MPKHTKFLLAAMGVAMLLGLAGAAQAWFISLRATPPGVVDSALVHYLPERELRDVDSLLAYGSLVSGRSVGLDGVPLILPGDRLLSGKKVQVEGGVTTTTVRASTARPYVSGETGGTVINTETRTAADGAEVTRTQRHIMDVDSGDQWFEGDSAAPLAEAPTIDAGQYEAETTSATDQWDSEATTIIVSTITTTYTPKLENLPVYRRVISNTVTITHETAALSPADADWAALEPTLPAGSVKETVLYADPSAALPTRVYQVITSRKATPGAPDSAETNEVSVPLSVENQSTTATCLRLGLSAVTVKGGKAESLICRSTVENGVTVYHFGAYYTPSEGHTYFIELLSLTPAAGWTKVDDPDGGSLWTLWDRAETVPVVRDELENPVPTVYPVVDDFTVAAETHFAAEGVTKEIFETGFNALYSTGTPSVEIRLRFYARQSEYMDWTEFLSKDLTLTLSDLGKGVTP